MANVGKLYTDTDIDMSPGYEQERKVYVLKKGQLYGQFYVSLTIVITLWERGTLIFENMFPPDGFQASLCYIFLVGERYGMTQSIVRGAIPGLVPGMYKKAGRALRSKPESSFYHDFCISFCLQALP